MSLTLKRVTDRTLRWSRYSVRDEDGREVALVGEFHEVDPETLGFKVEAEYWLRYTGRPPFESSRYYDSPQLALSALMEDLNTA